MIDFEFDQFDIRKIRNKKIKSPGCVANNQDFYL